MVVQLLAGSMLCSAAFFREWKEGWQNVRKMPLRHCKVCEHQVLYSFIYSLVDLPMGHPILAPNG